MSKLVINDSTLTAIGDAIREKTGKADLIAPGDMPAEISSITTGGGGGGEVEPIVLSGDQQYGCAGAIATNYIEMYGDTISTKDITNLNSAFLNSKLKRIPFELNCVTHSSVDTAYLFKNATNLEVPPKLNNFRVSNISSMFYYCPEIDIPEDYFDNWDFSSVTATTSAYGAGSSTYMFQGCRLLKSLPENLFAQNRINRYTASPIYSGGFQECMNLKKIVLPVYDKASYTYNFFAGTVLNCWTLSDLRFNTNEDGSPIVCSGWKYQAIDLTSCVGYVYSTFKSQGKYDASLEVTDDASYQALKDNPNYWTCNEAYSRFNHDSAVNFINTLPDVSSGTGNTIKFKGASGSATDGGAINTLTEEEIAVAAAKGWTVTLV